jgi:uncharacterized protein YcbK (DUF882 family)
VFTTPPYASCVVLHLIGRTARDSGVIGENPPKRRRTQNFGCINTWDAGKNMSLNVSRVMHPSRGKREKQAGTDQSRKNRRLPGALVRENTQMNDTGSHQLTRRSLLQVFAATMVTAAPFFAGVPAYARGAGDIRKLNFYSGRTGEQMNIIYWIDGKYVPEALVEVNHFFRDWRNNKTKQVDARTLDFLAATHNLLRVNEPYMLLSGYRSPETNAMLRARSRNVARDSLHMRGQAADVRLQSRSVSQIARAAMACQGGGVGRYSGSNFVHFDCGEARSWGA